MTSTWTANKTWAVGEVVTAAMLNQYVRDNLDWVKTRPVGVTSDFDGTVGNTSSSSFTDMGSSVSLTTVSANAYVQIVCFGIATQGNAADVYNLTIDIDGFNKGDATRGMLELVAATNNQHTFCISWVGTITSAGAHTIKFQAKRSSGSSAGVTIESMQLWAMEVA